MRAVPSVRLFQWASWIAPACRSISIERIFTKSVSGQYWYLYKICAKALDEDAAEFFLKLHCRLTDQPISIQPIWPIYRKGPYTIHHNTEKMVFYIRGDAAAKSYPRAVQERYPVASGGMVEHISLSDSLEENEVAPETGESISIAHFKGRIHEAVGRSV